MTTPFNAALAAYGNTAKLIESGGGKGALASPGPSGPDFGQMLADSVGSVVSAGKASDQASMDMISGKANVVDVVTAISQTEIAMETMVTVRDRVISAYEEIMRMPI